MKLSQIILIALLFNSSPVFGQDDFKWWTDIHNWDGHTSWEQYMTISTSFMGPNALPVPEVMNGLIDSSAELEIAADYYYSKGDKTKDFFTRGHLPLFENRMSVAIDVVPYEWFSTDTLTRDTRAARTRSGKGGAGGDIYCYTDFQLLKNPDILFQVAFRLASGTNLRNARFTDGPGYFFNLSAGKNILLNNSILRFYAMTGFYAYQTFDIQHLQNDCFLFGGGVDITKGKWRLSQSIAGYSGYLNIGDKPLVYRAGLRFVQKQIDWKINYQWGLNDYPFQRFRIGIVWHMHKKRE